MRFFFSLFAHEKGKEEEGASSLAFLCVCFFSLARKREAKVPQVSFHKTLPFLLFLLLSPLGAPKKSWGPKKGRREKVIPASFSAIFSSFPPCFFGGDFLLLLQKCPFRPLSLSPSSSLSPGKGELIFFVLAAKPFHCVLYGETTSKNNLHHQGRIFELFSIGSKSKTINPPQCSSTSRFANIFAIFRSCLEVKKE